MPSETSRIEAFSDGVFAIAATLLILDVKIPQSNQANLAAQLGQQWPSYFAFLLSFLFIGIMWINHHRLFTHIKRTDNGLLILNLLLLLSVCAVPFPTAVLAVHLRSAGAHVAAISLQRNLHSDRRILQFGWRYAVSKNLLDHNTQASADAISKQYALGPLLYLVCIGLVWISVGLSLALNAALAIFFAIPPRPRKPG